MYEKPLLVAWKLFFFLKNNVITSTIAWTMAASPFHAMFANAPAADSCTDGYEIIFHWISQSVTTYMQCSDLSALQCSNLSVLRCSDLSALQCSVPSSYMQCSGLSALQCSYLSALQCSDLNVLWCMGNHFQVLTSYFVLLTWCKVDCNISLLNMHQQLTCLNRMIFETSVN